MKKFTLFILFLFFCLTVNEIFSQDDDPAKWEFFKIYVTTSDDSIFTKLQDDMMISPYLESYLIYVDIRSDKPEKRFLVLGEITHESSMKFAWSQISEGVKSGLLNWNKKNKMKVE